MKIERLFNKIKVQYFMEAYGDLLSGPTNLSQLIIIFLEVFSKHFDQINPPFRLPALALLCVDLFSPKMNDGALRSEAPSSLVSWLRARRFT